MLAARRLVSSGTAVGNLAAGRIRAGAGCGIAAFPSRLVDTTTTKRQVTLLFSTNATPAPPAAASGSPSAGDKHKVNKHPVSGPAGVLPRSVITKKMRKGVLPTLTRPPHHATDGTFTNPWSSYHEYGPTDFVREALPELRKLNLYPLPTVKPDWRLINAPREDLQTTWIGHASFLVQASGFNMLTDPVFSKRASPSQIMGPARFSPVPFQVEEMPPVHMVLISHNHYDHVDSGTISRLLEKEAVDLQGEASGELARQYHKDASDTTTSAREGKAQPRRPFAGTLWVCPARVSPLLHRLGVPKHRTVELDWWDGFVPGAASVSRSFASASEKHAFELEQKAQSQEAPFPTVNAVASAGSVVKAPLHDHIYDDATPVTAVAGAGSGAASKDAIIAVAGAGATDAEDLSVSHAPLTQPSVHSLFTSSSPEAFPTSSLPENKDLLAALQAGMPRIVCVPAQHQSARSLWDRNRTLWCGYVVITPKSSNKQEDTRFYFTGDTGYRAIPKGASEVPLSAEEAAQPRCPAFKHIGERYGPLDLCALPIGAYSPRFFMSSFHASPSDSAWMHRDVSSKRSVGMHWGVFPLTDEPIEEPVAHLEAAKKAVGLEDDEFVAVRAGATVGAKGGVLNAQHRARAASADDESSGEDADAAAKGNIKK